MKSIKIAISVAFVISIIFLYSLYSNGIILVPKFERTGGYRIQCEVGPGEQLSQSTINYVCRILKRRIDPTRRLGISIQVVKNNLIEIRVPVTNFNTRVNEKFDENYRSGEGYLDRPSNLLRMLKGAGALEFRILPTSRGGELTLDEQQAYTTALRTEGPRAASDAQYKWCEVEDASEESVNSWTFSTEAIVGEFGERFFILASNEVGQCLLHGGGEKKWKLERSHPTSDQMGRRAIAFSLDDRGAVLFASLTGDNINRPLCILLDDRAISAPNINSRIYKNGIIEGSYTETAVNDLVNKLNAGSLPARLIPQPISEKSIGSSLGEASRTKGVYYAGIIGLTVVLAFMLVYLSP